VGLKKMQTLSKRERAIMMRRKRPALKAMGYADMCRELWEISDEGSDVVFYLDQDEDNEKLLESLGGDMSELEEYKIGLSELADDARMLIDQLRELNGPEREPEDEPEDGSTDGPEADSFQVNYDDCTVALIGDRVRLTGYDHYENDYLSLCDYDSELAFTDAGKRLMRLTKKDMLSRIGQCMGIFMAFLDVRERYDYLRAAIDAVMEEKRAVNKLMLDIFELHEKAEKVEFDINYEETQKFNQLLDRIPERMWVE